MTTGNILGKALPAAFLLLLLLCGALHAERQDILLNDGWSFRFSHQVERGTERRVDLPHTWNAKDALSGKLDYKRGIGNYEKKIAVPAEWKGKRLFLRFEGANSVANVFVNRRWIGEHRGGYGAFVFEITDRVNYGKENTITVRLNNGERLDVMPLVGDFNFYGGIYRDVHLLVTDDVCISPLDYASSGVRLFQEDVSEKQATVRVVTALSNGADVPADVRVRARILADGKVVQEKDRAVSVPADASARAEIEFDMKNPRLWNGREDPFLYRAEIVLLRGGKEIDRVEQPLGLRFFRIDPDKGFFLNGKRLPLRGVCRHQDRDGIGNALSKEHHDEDMAIMLEMGVNAVRLAHYPHAEYFYDLADKHGLVVWAEIPFVGPGGYLDKGFVDHPAFRANGKEQLKEMIRQHGNHPSVCMWGLFNELTAAGDDPCDYIRELDDLAHEEDPTRPTVAASNQQGAINFITDAIAWNRYDGWYGGTPADLGRWLDSMHKNHPELRIGISEYGAGGSILHQQDELKKPVAASRHHPENWQTHYHIENWKILSSRPFVWGSFVWNMFDFGAAHRREGDRPGINDKGLVTFDRKIRKDAFYFYKANWIKDVPVLHLAGKRHVKRSAPAQTVLAFTNLPEAELFVNGESRGTAEPDAVAVVTWKNVALRPGENEIRVEARAADGKKISDSVSCVLAPAEKKKQ